MPGRKVVVVLPHTGKERYKVHACLMASHNGGVPTVLLRTNTCGGAKPARLVLILLATRQATCVLKTTLHARSSLYTSHAPNGVLSTGQKGMRTNHVAMHSLAWLTCLLHASITSSRAKRCPFLGPKTMQTTSFSYSHMCPRQLHTCAALCCASTVRQS